MSVCVCVCVCSSQLWYKRKVIFSVRGVAASTSCQAYPEEGIERSILHEFGDDEDGAAPRQHALQPDHVWMVELTHDRGLGEEVPPLALGVAGFQRLDRHDHLPAAGLLETSAAHLAKFTWVERTRWGWGGEEGVGWGWGWWGRGVEWAEERRGGVEGKRELGKVRGEGALLVGIGSEGADLQELRAGFNCGREEERRGREVRGQRCWGERGWPVSIECATWERWRETEDGRGTLGFCMWCLSPSVIRGEREMKTEKTGREEGWASGSRLSFEVKLGHNMPLEREKKVTD